MPSLTVENYLKAILQIALKTDSPQVAPGRLAAALDVSPGTVTSMLKTLAEADPPLVDYTPYSGVTLTEAGRQVALKMIRRHRLIELFLVRTLNLAWDQVHDEAEHMEHAVSDFLIDRMDDYLGRPPLDPHGDPIPTADGRMPGSRSESVALADCPPRTRIRLVRVTHQSSVFLRYLTDSGLELGCEGVVRENNAEAGLVTIQFDGARSVSMGRSAAEHLRVERLDPPAPPTDVTLP